uniref:Putative secreted protein n=1 Tax=Haematobia irritans TaxID=7368 RepID=A0A1L8EG49_HAEIR
MASNGVQSSAFFYFAIFLAIAVFYVRDVSSLDIEHSGIVTVTNETRYFALNPNASRVLFNKEHYAKGNIIFSSGERIDGDRLILTYMDETQFTRNEDAEVLIRYPGENRKGLCVSCVQIYADVSTTACDTYFVDGGTGLDFCKILISCNQTSNLGYQIYMYGY